MTALPMANDRDVATLAHVVATTAVKHGSISPQMRQELARVNRTEVSRTLQWRLVRALNRATVRRLHEEGIAVPALQGFFAAASLLDAEVFREALQDLQERFASAGAPGVPSHFLVAPLIVALDFAAAQEPTLGPLHLQALCAHIDAQTAGRF